MEVYSIGFTQKSAEEFFTKLKDAGIKRLVDVRHNNTSQLAGFAKRDDLAFFLRENCGAQYLHELLFAPPQDLLTGYRKGDISWGCYEHRFNAILEERQVAERLDPEMLLSFPTVLLCSEPAADYCHRRLVLQHLQHHWGDFEIIHL